MKRESQVGADDSAPEESPPGPRREVGSAAESRKHPPHPTVSDAGVEATPEAEGEASQTPLPANAHGVDRVDLSHQPPIQEGSMYEHRPAEDKDRPPSGR